jgi:uncharacterized protein YegL
MSLTASPDRRFLRAGQPTERFVVLALRAPVVATGTRRPPVRLAFALDRSGSMTGAKIRHARDAILAGLARLEPRDSFAVVAFDDRIEVVVPATPATPDAVQAARRSVGRVEPRGSTFLQGGWSEAVTQLSRADAADRKADDTDDAVSRVLLLTDGLANVGLADPGQLAADAAKARAHGVTTSTFGVGEDFDEGLLARMADGGGGSFRYIDEPEKIAAFLDAELGEALAVVARDVALEILAPEGVAVDVIGPYPRERLDGRTRISLPDLVSGQDLEIVVRLRFLARPAGAIVPVRFAVEDREDALGGASVSLDWSATGARDDRGQPRDLDVDRLVGERFAARARDAPRSSTATASTRTPVASSASPPIAFTPTRRAIRPSSRSPRPCATRSTPCWRHSTRRSARPGSSTPAPPRADATSSGAPSGGSATAASPGPVSPSSPRHPFGGHLPGP